MGKYQTINGTPWHVETLRKDEDDDRRHRSRCIHYGKDHKCSTLKSPYYGLRCGGSNKCEEYKEKTESISNNQVKSNKYPDRKQNLCMYLKNNKCTYSHTSKCYDYKNCNYYKEKEIIEISEEKRDDKNAPCQ